MDILIFGTGQLAELANFYFTNDSNHSVIGFFVDSEYKKDDVFCGLPVYTYEEVLTKKFGTNVHVSALDNHLRAKKYDDLKNNQFNFVSYISTKAVCNHSSIGENCFILENNVIQPFVKIGNNNIFWSGNHIGHHSKVGDHVFISSHVVICGNCEIKSFSWLGVNSSIRDGCVVEENTKVCMDTMIYKNTKVGKKYQGVPGREI